MDDIYWIKKWSSDLNGARFTSQVHRRLDAIAEAEGLTELGKTCGEFGGLLRRKRERARLDLVHSLMAELNIEPTIHVARLVMMKAFRMSAHNEELRQWFSETGRTHESNQFTIRARLTLASKPAAVRGYNKLYATYCGLLRMRIKEIKLQRKLANQ